MRILASLLAIFCTLNVTAQRTYSELEIKRLADLGRLWGMLHYFHPKMATGEIATDSLILSPTASLIADPSAENFERCVKDMLSRLNDPSTQLIKKLVPTSSLLFTSDPYKPAVHKLPNDIWYFAFPTAAAKWDNIISQQGLIPSQWDSAKAIILDLRNAKNILEDGVWAFQYYLPAIIANHLGGVSLPYVYERSIYHQGFLSQSDRKFNLSGWKIFTQGGWPVLTPKGKPFQKPLLIIFNTGTNLDRPIANFIQSLKAAGLCKIIFEGSEAEYPVGKMVTVDLTDSLFVNLRVSDFLINDNQFVPVPDWHIDHVSDTSLSGTFVKRCVELLSENKNDLSAVTRAGLSMRFVPPMPGRYVHEPVPFAEKRLFALYNWWNAIQYFYPYKKLIDRNWNSVLTEYIPELLNATDTLTYNFALMGMVSEINDSHANVASFNGPTPFILQAYRYMPPLQAAFIENKILIIKKAADSLQDMDQVHLWDEIINIDGKEINEVKEEWKHFFKRSNENGFMTDMANFLLRGKVNSTIRLGLLRNGRKFTVTIKRSGLNRFFGIPFHFQDEYETCQFLEKEIGYIKMGSLKQNQVDSVLDAFEKTKAIIFDLRAYPQGTIDLIASRITCQEIKTVQYEKPFVTAGYIKGDDFDSASLISYNTIKPLYTAKCYKGKVVVLVNEATVSSGEFSTMVLQAASSNTTTIGSQTAGADGAITQVVFPGGYIGQFSGFGVKYPDGRQTQRIGVKIDIEVKPTIAGFKAGKDEVLLRAIEFIKKGK